MIEQRGRFGAFIGAGAFLLATGLTGCASLTGGHVDCNVVRLQSQSGRDDAQIASALGASESDVAACHSAAGGSAASSGGGSGGPPNASEYGIPAGMEGGGAQSGGAEGGGAAGGASTPPASQ